MKEFMVRFQGKWVRIRPQPFEPERMTTDVAWLQITQNISPQESYRKWFEQRRIISSALQ
jgi:hypothetical protein